MESNSIHDISVCEYGCQQLFRHINAFSGEIDGAKHAADIEPIHQLRVYSRRISTTLRLFDTCYPLKTAKIWRKKIRKTACSFGEVRDLDVQIEFLQNYQKEINASELLPGVQRLELRLTQHREKLQRKTIIRLEKLEKGHVLNDIQSFLAEVNTNESEKPTYSQELYQLANQAIESSLQNMMNYDGIVLQPEKVEELHKMRIAAKGLRYTIEVFAAIYPDKLKKHFQAVKLTQEMLGNIHDMDVWKELVPEFITAETRRTVEYYGDAAAIDLLLPGLNQFQTDVCEKRDQTYSQFTQTWQHWKQEGLWENLVRKTKLPLK